MPSRVGSGITAGSMSPMYFTIRLAIVVPLEQNATIALVIHFSLKGEKSVSGRPGKSRHLRLARANTKNVRRCLNSWFNWELIVSLKYRLGGCSHEEKVKAISYCHKLPLRAHGAAPGILSTPTDPFYSSAPDIGLMKRCTVPLQSILVRCSGCHTRTWIVL